MTLAANLRAMQASEVRALGDLLVRAGSALGLGRRRVVALDPCERTTLAATNHFALLKDRCVAEALVGWLA